MMKPMASMLILKYVRSRLEAFEITPAGAAAPWAHSPVSERTPLDIVKQGPGACGASPPRS